ncbi:hypothetical protein OG311_35940 [Streptomyces sp. NBC_01343]|uniref:hypothetical protein n=1 Tax=Streptomyces sp. NBC_01343 TaxID=2903832 RepID=UPI002E1649F9|nr:hypothetical protein OG311_35940 [Streptomyces sp. NBC_01343]
MNAFVSAHARARRESDTPAFRAYLHGLVSRSSGFDPRLERYWALVGTATGGRVLNMTVAHRWLTEGLSMSMSPEPVHVQGLHTGSSAPVPGQIHE